MGKSVNCHYALCVTDEEKVSHILTFTIHPSKDNTHVSFTEDECLHMVNDLEKMTIGNFVFNNFANMNKKGKTTRLRYLDHISDEMSYVCLHLFKCDDMIENKVIELITKIRMQQQLNQLNVI